MAGKLKIMDLGAEVGYIAAFETQEKIHEERRSGRAGDHLLLLEHKAVYTMGRSAKPENLVWNDEELAAAGIESVSTTRGGDVTYHGPGQLVGYPIIHLGQRGMRVHDYIEAVEEVLIVALATFGIDTAGRDKRNRGVWVGNDKIAAIGIRISRQVSMHGFALNVNTRLNDYRGIVPCGLNDAGVTSMARILGEECDMALVKKNIGEAFATVFRYDEVCATTLTN